MNAELAELTDTVLAKEARLKGMLAEYPSIAIAYSGGVDSSYLAAIAHEVLRDRATMILADSPSIPRSEVNDATTLARERGWNLTVINTQEFENEEFAKNDGRRCYFCKSELFARMTEYAQEHKVEVLAYGAMADDEFDPTRMGHVAAREYHIVAPLQSAGMGKEEIRALSAQRGLPTASKASFACLASRFPVGTRVTAPEVQKVEQAEEILKTHGLYQYRARHHGDICRIEIDPQDFRYMLDPEVRQHIVDSIKAVGYKFVTLDLAGYRTGSTAG